MGKFGGVSVMRLVFEWHVWVSIGGAATGASVNCPFHGRLYDYTVEKISKYYYMVLVLRITVI